MYVPRVCLYQCRAEENIDALGQELQMIVKYCEGTEHQSQVLCEGNNVVRENCLYSVNHVLNADWPGREYRWVNQTGSRGRMMRTEVFWEEGSSFASPAQITEEATCELLLL